jgi:hypothetical protein
MAFTEEQLAAAFMAKLAGSTLREVDENTTQQSSAGPATKIDPKQFLKPVYQQPVQMPPQPQLIVQQQIPQQPAPTEDPNQLTFNFESTTAKETEAIKLLKQIRDSLTEVITLIKKQNNAENSTR